MLKQVLEAPGLFEWFEGAIEAGNPDALLLALKLREKVAADNKLFGKLLPDPYSSSTLFSAAHLSSLANCFKVIIIMVFCIGGLVSRLEFFVFKHFLVSLTYLYLQIVTVLIVIINIIVTIVI